MLGAGETFEIEDPDFEFGDDGEIIQLPPGTVSLRTPATPSRASRSEDALHSDKVRKELDPEHRVLDQVSYAMLLHISMDYSFSHLFHLNCFCGFLTSLPRSQDIQVIDTKTSPDLRKHALRTMFLFSFSLILLNTYFPYFLLLQIPKNIYHGC